MNQRKDANHPLLSIYRTLKRLYLYEMSTAMQQWGLNRMEMDVILFLDNNPGKDTAAEIAAEGRLTKSHVSTAVNHLTEMGLLEQQRDERNHRRIRLKLTQNAEPLLEAGHKARQHFEEVLFRNMSGEDILAFRRLICQINQNAANAMKEVTDP